MVAASFAHVGIWVFDLDNTLYPPEARLFDQIEVRMEAYVQRELGVSQEEADRLRSVYWKTYGTTMSGLMNEHGIDPDPFLDEVHDIDFSVLNADPVLAERISKLPGRKIVYTNGARPYAHNVLKARGLDGVFDAVYGVEHAGYLPKPEQAAFEAVFALDGVDPTRGAMFEDDLRNLAVPHLLGMRTVHVWPEPLPADHIHHHTADLSAFLSQLV
ncbi:pyrimidine 5'-nucleotidase [Marivivens donghaensis]|uniref:Pyrimidine 5'-nucleotidase n=1 Tax=Marivivens donghaensis TaxID=1699413 RepID=A0ABX0VWS3_9RHOB|nr:pyrimidine 5'-nucleotidase [Marivivens donghaensis]NIY72138.1 pyrimidine 5'-nucleotidase [Marivivens donghaensis]